MPTEHEIDLRDWFAGQALSAYPWTATPSSYEDKAKSCYQIADAMMKARKPKYGRKK